MITERQIQKEMDETGFHRMACIRRIKDRREINRMCRDAKT